jgi:hypothetical protein
LAHQHGLSLSHLFSCCCSQKISATHHPYIEDVTSIASSHARGDREVTSPEGRVCGILWHQVEDGDFGYAFLPEPIWQLEFQGERRQGAIEVVQGEHWGDRKGVEAFSGVETGGVSFVGKEVISTLCLVACISDYHSAGCAELYGGALDLGDEVTATKKTE